MAIQLPNLLAKRLTPVVTSVALASGIILSLSSAASAAAGLSFSSSGVISDRIDLQQQRIIANLRSSYLLPIETGSRFISDATPPAPGRRVIIRNVTPGFSSEPFSDRAYEDRNGSEVILLKPGQGHETQTFTVIPGQLSAPLQNEFRYEIRENSGTVLESGGFSISIGINDQPISTVLRSRHSSYPTHGYAPNYYNGYASYGYGGFNGRRHSIFPRSHFRQRIRKFRQFRHHRH